MCTNNSEDAIVNVSPHNMYLAVCNNMMHGDILFTVSWLSKMCLNLYGENYTGPVLDI